MAKRKSSSRSVRKQNLAPRIIIGVIVLAVIVVAVSLLSSVFMNTENSVKGKLATMAADYYENYLYKNLAESEIYKSSDEDLKDMLKEYAEVGLSSITLRQLLLYDDKKYADDTGFLTKYCNENRTYVKFYPEEPFERSSYRAEFTYACNFD